MESTDRIYLIDLLRFIAALSVVLFHFTFRGFMADGWSCLEFNALGAVFKYGYLGVHLFFLISGFVISLSVQNATLSYFIGSRAVRLYPAYWFCATVTFITVTLWGAPVFTATAGQYLVNLTMLQEFFKIRHLDGVYWTLTIELKFYFLIALCLLINTLRKNIADLLIFPWLFISLLLHAVAGSTLFIFKLLDFFFIPNYSHYFIAGMLFYKIYTKGVQYTYLLGLITCLALSLYHAVGEALLLENKFNSVYLILVIVVLIILFYTAMFLCSTKKLQKINLPVFAKAGVITYPLYLLHDYTGFVIFNAFGTPQNKYLLLAGVTAGMIAAAYAIHVYIEKPVSRFMKKWIYGI